MYGSPTFREFVWSRYLRSDSIWYSAVAVETLERGGYVIQYDANATADAYAKLVKSGAESCICDSCENFVLARSGAFPEEFMCLLSSMGIDWQKEGEAYEMGKDETGLYLYGGWFHFVGRVVQTGAEIDINGFRFSFDPPGQVPRADEPFPQGLISAVEFVTHLPWLSKRPEPDAAAPMEDCIWRRLGRRLGVVR